jgi:hypothetical protein
MGKWEERNWNAECGSGKMGGGIEKKSEGGMGKWKDGRRNK